MGCATGLVKLIVFVFNFLCALVGLALIILGAIGVSKLADINTLVTGPAEFVPGFILGLGVFIFVIAFLGCCGVMQRSQCMLTTYAVVLLVLFIVQFSISIYGIVTIKDFKESAKKGIEKELKNITDHYDEIPKDLRESMDKIQREYQCCGFSGPGDYKHPPDSCCKTASDKASCEYFNKGCLEPVLDLFDSTFKIITYVALGICAVELVGALFAICLVNSYKNENRINHY